MAERPVFRTWNNSPYMARVFVNFEWFAGLSKSQKQKSIRSLHESYHAIFPEQKILEISGKSESELGRALSAFSLTKYVPSLGASIPVENIYQSSKVFTEGGPYTDLLMVKSLDAKRDSRLKSSGSLTGFSYEGMKFPVKPRSLFYEYIYMNALLEHEDLAAQLMEYDAFTDIEFNHKRSESTQALAAARFVSLARAGLLDEIRDPKRFLKLMTSDIGFIREYLDNKNR